MRACIVNLYDNSSDMYLTWDAYDHTKILVHVMQLDEKAGKSSSVDSLVEHLEIRNAV